METPQLVEVLGEAAQALADTPLAIDLADAPAGRTQRDELRDQISSYLLPRLAKLDAPLLVVLGGSTGSGKSSLTNAIVGAQVARPGVLRPTTRRPVLVCNPADRAWFANEVDGRDGVLPELSRTVGGDGDDQPGADGLRLVANPAVPAGLALLDSPDIDSVEIVNHDLAALLLGAADLWIFVTTAVRYADAVPWEYLARAEERAVAIAVVINRIPPGAEDELAADLRTMLDARGLAEATLFEVTEGQLDEGAAAIRTWLGEIAASSETRDRVARQTVNGLVASMPTRLEQVAAAAAQQRRSVDDLIETSEAAWRSASREVDARLDEGVELRSEVLERFSEHVGASELMGRFQRAIGRLRDRVTASLTGKAAASTEVRREIGDTIEQIVVRIADRTSLEVTERWDAMPGGAQVLAASGAGLDRATPELSAATQKLVRDWQDATLNLIADTAGSKAAVARGLSLGINGVGAALMIVLFSQTGGLTGGEAAIAGGTAAASQTVLTAVFGDQAVRQLEREVRADLLRRIEELFKTESGRFRTVADRIAPSTAERLDGLAQQLAGATLGPATRSGTPTADVDADADTGADVDTDRGAR